jgi:hypothetical protein
MLIIDSQVHDPFNFYHLRCFAYINDKRLLKNWINLLRLLREFRPFNVFLWLLIIFKRKYKKMITIKSCFFFKLMFGTSDIQWGINFWSKRSGFLLIRVLHDMAQNKTIQFLKKRNSLFSLFWLTIKKYLLILIIFLLFFQVSGLDSIIIVSKWIISDCGKKTQQILL